MFIFNLARTAKPWPNYKPQFISLFLTYLPAASRLYIITNAYGA